MDINQKMLLDLADELGLGSNDQESMKKAARAATAYKNNDEDEILAEILALKRTMRTNPEQFEKQLSAIKALRPMLNLEQKSRLDKIIVMLEK